MEITFLTWAVIMALLIAVWWSQFRRGKMGSAIALSMLMLVYALLQFADIVRITSWV